MKIKFNYGPIIIIISFLAICTSLGFCSANRSMYFQAITDVFDGEITRFQYSFTMTIRYVTTTVFNIFFGVLVNKFGTKILMSAGFLSLISFALVNSFATHILHFYIASVFLGMGLAWTTTAMASAIVNNWFTKNKATILGLILSANGLGGAVSAQILSPIIFSDGGNGFRDAYRLVAVILTVMLLLIILFFKERPKGAERVLLPKKRNRTARANTWTGMDFSAIKKKPYFYLTLLCMLLTGMSLNGLSEIASLHMYDVGLSKPFIALIASAGSLLLMGSKFFNGFMYDKIGIKKTMNVCYVSSFLALLWLVFISNTTLGKVFASTRIIFSALSLPLETVMISVFASELFGSKSFNKVIGLFTAATTAGFALASPFSQLWELIFGNYTFSIISFAVFMIFVAITMQFNLKSAYRDREAIIEAEKASLYDNATVEIS